MLDSDSLFSLPVVSNGERFWSEVNQKIKVYPNGTKHISTFNYSIFHSPCSRSVVPLDVPVDFPIIVRPDILVPPADSSKQDRDRFDNINRSIQSVFDIALLNDFDFFVTLTFDPKKVDSKDYNLVHETFKKWLKYNRKKYMSDFRYLFVAELHKSGAVHFHGLVSSCFDMVDSGTFICSVFDRPVRSDSVKCHGCSMVCDARCVFNMPEWRFGFSTAIRFQKIDDGYKGTTAIAKYLVKYITKDSKKILPHYYYAGGKLDRVVPTYYNIVDYNSADGQEFYVPNTGTKMKVKYAQVGL